MTLDLRWGSEQQAIADAVAKLCRDRVTPAAVDATAGRFPHEIWAAIAELGFLALGTPEGGGGALEMVAAVEVMGGAAVPGPITETFFATRLLETEERERVASGAAIVSVVSGTLVPWAEVASTFLQIDGDRVRRVDLDGPLAPLETLAGERWARGATKPAGDFADASQALVLYDLARAAYLGGAGHRLVSTAAEHARGRIQFGKSIGRFQAVAHPLADCAMHLSAAVALTRAAAFHFDGGAAGHARGLAGAALRSSRAAALDAANVAHQVFGALGITLEGPAYRVSRRIRQLASFASAGGREDAAILAHFGVVEGQPAPRPGDRP